MDIEAKITSPSSSQQAHLSDASPQLNVGDATQVALQLRACDVQAYQRQGNDLVMVLTSGQTIVLKGYFQTGDEEPELLLLDDEAEYVRVSFLNNHPGILEPVVAASCEVGASEVGASLWSYAFGAVALGALAYGASKDDGGQESVFPRQPAPSLSLEINPTDGKTISGTATPGATVAVDIDGDGKPDLFTVADREGNWSVDPEPDLPDGTQITAWAIGKLGNTSDPVTRIVENDDGGMIPNAPAITAISDDSGAPGDGITNDNTLVFSGTAQPGATVEVFLNGEPIGTTIAGPDGGWTFDHTGTPLPDGTYVVTSRQTDAEGNGPSELSPGLQVTVDTTPPNAPAVTAISDDSGTPGDGNTNDNTLIFSGTAEPNATVEVFLNGSPVGTATADPNGAWTFNHTGTPLPDGAYEVTTRQTDAAGNGPSPLSTPFNVTVDTTPPNAPAITTFSDDSGTPGDGITNDNTLVFNGTAEPNAPVEVFVDGVSVGTTTADPSGAWTFDHTGTPLADGPHAVTATQTDAAGNPSAPSAPLNVTVDTTPPAPPVVTAISDDSGASGTDGITSDNTLIFTGTAEPNAPVEVFLDGVSLGTTTTDASGNWSFDHTGTTLPDGPHVVTARQTLDTAGNGPSALSSPFNVTVDTTTPTAPVVTGISADSGASGTDGITNDNTLVFNGTAEPNAAVAVFLNGAAIGTTTADAGGNWTFNHTGTTLADGNYAVTATQTDVAGNGPSAPSAPFAVTVDTTAPAAPAVTAISDDSGTPGDGNTNDNTLIFSGTAEPNAAVAVFLNGAPIGTTTADAGGNWSFDHTGTTLADGNYAVTATQTDAAGNPSPPSAPFNVTVSTGLPLPPVVTAISTDTGSSATDEITNDNTLQFIGTAAPNAIVEVFLNGASIGNTTANASGDWTFDHTGTTLADGNYTVTATQTDAESNTSPLSAPLPVTVDTTTPPAPVVNSISTDTGLSSADEITSDQTLEFIGTAEANAAVEVFLNGASIGTTTADALGNWTFDHTGTTLAPGNYEVTARQTDVAGNGPSPLSASLPVIVDIVAELTIDGMLNDFNTFGDFATTVSQGTVVSGTADPGATVTLTVNGAPQVSVIADSTGVWQSFLINLALGSSWNVEAQVTNLAGGTNSASQVITREAAGSVPVVSTGTLSPANGFIIQGDSADDGAGSAISNLGDINGDGIDDLIIGAWNGDDGGADAGEAYVIFGRSGVDGSGWGTPNNIRQVLDLTNLLPSEGFIIRGDAAGDLLGVAVSSAGDVNGDGIADLIVGASKADDGVDFDAGRAYVIYGKAGGVDGSAWGAVDGTNRAVLDLTGLLSADGFVIFGDSFEDDMGQAVSSAGDINGDGFADLLVGAPQGDDNSPNIPPTPSHNSGEVYVIFGGPTATNTNVNMTNLAPTDGFIIRGDSFEDALGLFFSVSPAGDVNNDGIADIIVAAPFGDDGGADAGEAYVIFGNSGPGGFGTPDSLGRQVVDTTSLTAAQGFIIQGDAAGDETGYSVASAGDLNGDGIADLMIGARGGSVAYVVYGKTSTSPTPGDAWGSIDGTGRQVLDLTNLAPADGFIIQGVAGTRLGESISSAGDVNGDGIEDLIVGARLADQAYVLFGTPSGGLGTVDGTGRQVLDVTNLAHTDGILIQGPAGENLGTDISSAGDLNGDGFDDLFVSEFAASGGGGGAGGASVIFGGPTASFDRIFQVGTAGADWLTGSDNNDQLLGGVGGADTMLAGAGNDFISIGDASFRRIDGGTGHDILEFSAGLTLDFTTLASDVVTGIEEINMFVGNSTLTLTAQDLLDMSDTDILRVEGDAGDTVNAAGFVDSGTDQTLGNIIYDVYTSGSATLWVDQNITIVV